jgi:hypothetical protein
MFKSQYIKSNHRILRKKEVDTYEALAFALDCSAIVLTAIVLTASVLTASVLTASVLLTQQRIKCKSYFNGMVE